MKTTINLTIFLFYSCLCLSQSKTTIVKAYVSSMSEEIDTSSIKKVTDVKISDYTGSYHFGGSEGESQLEIIHSNGKLFARSPYTYFGNNQNDLRLGYKRDPIEYSKGKIKIGKVFYELFICTKTRLYTLEKGTKGLVSHFFDSINGRKHHYIQFNNHRPITIKLEGKFPEASFVKLSVNDISNYSKYNLKIMKNEIFARKGYIFKKDGEMEKYFSQQIWYKTLKNKTKNINLDAIEKHNVDLILKLE